MNSIPRAVLKLGLFYAIVAEHLAIADIIFVGTRLAIDDDAEHFKNGIAMAVERRALQRVAVGHAVVNPFPVQFLERQFTTASERIDEPNVLMENLRYFHKI